MEIVSSFVFWLNVCPRKSGVSYKMIPSTIITWLVIDYKKQCEIHFGEYVQIHESHNHITGTACTIGDMALRLTVNEQDGYYLYSLRNRGTINHN